METHRYDASTYPMYQIIQSESTDLYLLLSFPFFPFPFYSIISLLRKLNKTFPFHCSDFVLSVNLKFTFLQATGSQRAEKHAALNQGNAGQTADSLTKAQQGSD